MDTIVILSGHLHNIWTLPDGDVDYTTPWGLMKAGFSRHIPADERRSASRIKRGERGIGQRRFWEHRLRNENDFARHLGYIHWNPVKHGHVQRVQDWPCSSFARFVAHGVYPQNWGGGNVDVEFEVGG